MARIRNATAGNDVRTAPLFETNQFIGFGTGSDDLTGGLLSDHFVMTADGNTDEIDGGLGFGIDHVDYSGNMRALTVRLGDGGTAGSVTSEFLTGFQQGPFGWSATYETKTVATLTSIENVTGSALGDSITGNSVSNVLDGSGGDDDLFGRAGNDTLIGGQGDDTLDGGNDNDTLIGGQGLDDLIGGAGTDTASYAGAATGMHIWLDTPLFSSPGSPILMGFAKQITANGLVAEDTLLGMENVIGSTFDDVIKSNGALNTIDGGEGNDVIQSWIDGQRDVMNGGEGSDTIDYTGFSQANGLIISLGENGANGSASFTTTANGVTSFTFEDTLVSIENATGTDHVDTIVGNSGANVLNGRSGGDFIFGGGGADTMSGGSGADTFLFSQVAEMPIGGARDQILDFERDIDLIDLSTIDANVNVDGNQAFTIVEDFTGTAGELVGFAQWLGASQTWSGDVNGDGIADFQIVVNPTDGTRALLSSGDFIL